MCSECMIIRSNVRRNAINSIKMNKMESSWELSRYKVQRIAKTRIVQEIATNDLYTLYEGMKRSDSEHTKTHRDRRDTFEFFPTTAEN